MNDKAIPESAFVIRTYAELAVWAAEFKQGRHNLLGIVSSPGLSKSTTFEKMFRGEMALFVAGHATAYQVYHELHGYRNKPVIIDDANTLFEDRRTRPLLIQLCETKPLKTLRWMTGGDLDVPKEYHTTSKVAILCNEFRASNRNLQAVLSRGIFVHFIPNAAEVHRYVGQWFVVDEATREIYDFIGGHLDLIDTPDIRRYLNARSLHHRSNWRDDILQYLCPKLDQKGMELAAMIMDDDAAHIDGEMERSRTFTRMTGLSQATYYRYCEIIRDNRDGSR